MGYETDTFRLKWTANYLGKILDSRARLDDYRALLVTVPTAQFPLFLKIGDVWEHDVSASVDINTDRGKLRLYGGINNVFNRISPFLPSGTESGQTTNINPTYNIEGRRFYFGARVEF